MNKKSFLKIAFAITLFTAGGLAVAAQTQTISNSQPNNSPGLTGGLFSATGLNTAGGIAGVVGGFALGGAGGSSAGLDAKRYALTGSNTGAAGAPATAPWNVWFATSYNKVGYGFAPLAANGHVNVFVGGVDYTFDNNMIAGVALSYDNTSVGLNSGSMTGTGYTVSPYLGVPITRTLAFDATIGFGRTTIDTSSLGVTGSSKDDRTVGAVGLTYRESYNEWTFTGRGSILSVHDKLGAYTLSNGGLVGDGTVNITQARLMAQAGYSMGNFTPFAGITLVYDISAPDQQPIGGVAAANDRSAYVPSVGIRFKADNNVYGAVQYSTEQGRSEVKNNQLLFNIGIRF